MADPTPLPPDWLETAVAAAAWLGLGSDLAGLPGAGWDGVCREVERTMAAREPLPQGWRAALARQAGRTDPEELARDEADAVLAARGEVFAADDDA